MPTFEFTSPDGKTYEVEGPEGATEEQAFQMLQTELGQTAKPAEPAAPKQSKFERAQSDFVAGLKKLPKDAAALADMVASIPGQLIGVGADMGMRAVALGYGIDHRTAGIMAQKFRQDVADPLSNPIEKLMHAFGYDKGYTDANVAQAMNKVGGWMEKGGEYVERQTGGLLTREDVDSLANTALATIGAQGTSLALKKRLDKLGKVAQEDLPSLTDKQRAAEAEAPKPAAKPAVNAAAIDELLGIKPAPERAAANKARRAETRGAFVDDPDLADYYAAKAEERRAQSELQQPERGVVEENFPQPKEALPEVPPDVMIADALGNVAKTPKELALLRDPGTQAAIAAYQAKKGQPGYGVMKGQRGGADFGAHEDLVKFLQGLGFPDPKAVAAAALASIEETRAVPRSQRGAIDMQVFDKSFRREKELPDGVKLVLEGGEEGPMVRAWQGGKEVGRLGLTADDWFNPKPESNLQAAWVDTHGAPKTGLAEAMYKFAAEQGDIVKSKAQTEAGKAMWEKFEKKGLAKDGKIERVDAPSVDMVSKAKEKVQAAEDKLKRLKDSGLYKNLNFVQRMEAEEPLRARHIEALRAYNDLLDQKNAAAREAELDVFKSFTKDVGEFTAQERRSGLKVVSKKESGKAAPKDLAKLAAVGTGALVGSQISDDPLFGAITGAAFTAAAGYLASKGAKPGLEVAAKGLDYVGGNLSTRIGNMSQPILHRAREYERGVLERTHKLLDRAHPFIEQLSKVKGEKGEALARAILTNDPIAVKAALDAVGNSKLTAEFRNVQGMLEEVGKELQAHGRLGTLRENYFPRVVKDLDGLMAALGAEVRTKLQKDLAAAEVDAMRRGQTLSDLDRTIIVNRSLLSMGDALKGKPGFSKARQIAAVTKELQPFYASPVESLHSYLSQASKDLEKAKFFGRDLVKAEGKVDLDASIGRVVSRELDAGNITFAQAEELGSMLRSRFGPGEASSAGLIQDVKNMINAGLLGNVVSAATQLGDVGTTVAIQGLRPTMESVVRQLTGRNQIDMKAFGLADHISEEFVSTRKSAKFLNATFKLGLFTGVDAFGKNVGLNAAHLKLRDLTKTVGGMRKLEAKYGEAFGPDFQALVQELRSGKMGDQTKAALFSELSDMQPISRLEVPQAYLDMPNGRALYMLKTFMLKQFDIVRREGYNEIKKGNVAGGVRNLTRYAIALGVSGATTDMIRQWLMGQTIDFDASGLSKNILKTFGWSEYVLDQVKKGEPVKAVGGTLLPPYKMFDDLYKASGGGELSEAAREKARDRAVQYVPVFGKLVESHLLGGAERRDAQAEKRKEKAQ